MEILTEDELLRVIHLQTRAMDVLYGCVVEEEGKRISHANYLYALKQECNLGDLPQFLQDILNGCREVPPQIQRKSVMNVPAATKESMAVERRAREVAEAPKHIVKVLPPIIPVEVVPAKVEEAVAEKKEDARQLDAEEGTLKDGRFVKDTPLTGSGLQLPTSQVIVVPEKSEGQKKKATAKEKKAHEAVAVAAKVEAIAVAAKVEAVAVAKKNKAVAVAKKNKKKGKSKGRG